MGPSGGNSTMLGQWRIVIRQAEEAAALGHLDEALRLVARPEVADHRQAVQFRGRIVQELIGRALRRAEAEDIAGALDDLRLAEQSGAPPDALATARLRLAEQVSAEIEVDLIAGEPGRVVDRIESLARQKVGGPALRRMREAAEAWQNALDDLRRGEFGRALESLDRAERLAGESVASALAATRREVAARQQKAHPPIDALYQALDEGRWPAILTAAESVLEVVPEHPVARQARARAWQQIAAVGPTTAPLARPPQVGRPVEPPRLPMTAPAPRPNAWNGALHTPARGLTRSDPSGPGGRVLLWVDAVGGYLVCLDSHVILGRAGPDSEADIPVLGDLSRHHASLIRDGDSYVLRAVKPTFVNGSAIQSAPLRDGDLIRLGATVELEFRQPSPVSSTARLEIVSRHRLPLAVDGVILMAETCIIGPSAQAHVPASNLSEPVVLYRQGPSLWCRAPGGFEVDGRACTARAALTLQSSVFGEGFSFSLEPLGCRSSQV